MNFQFPQKERYRYEAQRVDGRWDCLVHTMAPYENHSAIQTFALEDPADEASQLVSVHDRLLQKLLVRLAPGEEDCALLLLLLWRKLLEKVCPLRILWAGGCAHAWEGMFADILRTFHAGTQIWHLNGAREGDWSPIHMDWQALLLPEQAVDVLVIEDSAEAGVPSAAAEPLLRTVKPWGMFIVSSEHSDWWRRAETLGEGAAYRVRSVVLSGDAGTARDRRIVSCRVIRPEDATELHAATPAGEIERICAAIAERLQIVKTLMEAPLSLEDAETVLETARQVEQGICQIFPALHSRMMKYHANEWKRALLSDMQRKMTGKRSAPLRRRRIWPPRGRRRRASADGSRITPTISGC